MLHHVRETLLQNAEKSQFHVTRWTVQLSLSLKVHRQTSSLAETLEIPVNCGLKAPLFQHRRIEQIGNRSNFLDAVVQYGGKLLELMLAVFIESRVLP